MLIIVGDTGLDGTNLLPPPLSPPIVDVPATIAMRNAILAEPAGAVWIVATGALTNVALLFAAFPELIARIKGLSIMGGAIGDNYTQAPMGKVNSRVRIGNITPYAEFNIYCDPEAARSIFRTAELSGKTWLVPLDVSHLVLATPDIQHRLLFAADKMLNGYSATTATSPPRTPSRLRQMLHDILLFYATTYDKVFGISAGPPLHDPLAVAILLDPENTRFSYRADQHPGGERWDLNVVTQGEHEMSHSKTPKGGSSAGDGGIGTLGNEAESNMLGRTILRQLEPNSLETKGEGVRVPRSVDVMWFWNELLAAVDRAEKHVQSLGGH